MISRGFGFYSALIGLVLTLVGMAVGVSQSTTTNSGLYGVIIIYLFNFTDFFQWILRQIVTSESLLISYERAMQITNLPAEKELRNEYDEEIGLGEEVDAARNDRDLHQEWPKSP